MGESRQIDRSQTGVTIAELLVVVVVISVLIGFAHCSSAAQLTRY